MGRTRPSERLPLPIDEKLPAIAEALGSRGAVVVVAEPGAGKTTRVPGGLLDAGLAGDGQVVVLQPRRVAARLSAQRVAEERGVELGAEVGYAVRFDRKASSRTRVLFTTEGLFVRRLLAEPSLPGVALVIFDELHERHVEADVALALVRQLRATERPDLRVVAMSATLDSDAVAGYLDAETISVPGRTFPVEIDYDASDATLPLERRVARAAKRALDAEADGDVLVFLPGGAEIRRAEEACGRWADALGVDVLPLHGDLPLDAQVRATRPGKSRRVVLSTNLAETSLTIPSVVAVVDSGLARVASASSLSEVTRLDTAKISQASAAQRAGRAGRVREGRAIRLYDRHDLAARPQHDAPEIHRADLTQWMLLLASLGHAFDGLDWLDSPATRDVGAARELLVRLGALDGEGITALGRDAAALPTHPRLATVLLRAEDEGVGPRGALIAAIAGERELLAGGRRGRARARTAGTGSSDLLDRLERIEAVLALGGGAGRARRHDLDARAFDRVVRVRDQLARARRLGREPDASLDDEEERLVHAIIAGFPDRVARRRGERLAFAFGGAARLAPESVVGEGKFVVATDAIETARGLEVSAATAVSADDLFTVLGERLDDHREVRLDQATGAVVASTGLRYGQLAIDESVTREVTDEEAAACLALHVQRRGLGAFWDADEVESLRRRLAFAASHGLAVRPLDEDFEREVLEALATGARTVRDLRGRSFLDIAIGLQPPGAWSEMGAFAPAHVTLPGRQRVPVNYELDRPPWIASRIQDFFSMADGPKVARGAIPLVLHLTAPNDRPMQVTNDLAGFWERHWPALKKELGRRYPKHYWPEDPRAAKAARLKRHGAPKG